MKADPSDRIDPRAMVKGTMLRAHLSWATSRFGAGYNLTRLRSLGQIRLQGQA